MRICEAYAALLDAFVDGELSGPEEARVRDHLADCPACAAYVADAMAIRAAFPALEDTEAPEGLADGVMAAIRADAAPRRKTRRWLRTAVSLAACAAVVFAVWRAVPPGGGMSGGAAPAAAGAGSAEQYSEPAGGVNPENDTENGVAYYARDAENGEEEAAPESAPQVGSSLTMSGAGDPAAPVPDGDGGTETDAAEPPSAPAVQKALGGEREETAGGGLSVAPSSVEDGVSAQAAGDGSETAADWEYLGRELNICVTDAPAYEELLADLGGYTQTIGKRSSPIEITAHTENGSNIAWYAETAGDGQWELFLSFADGSVASLPLVAENIAALKPPDRMWFEGDAFLYEITCEQKGLWPDGTVCHVEGVYRYTVDLTAKTVSLNIQ